MILKCICSYCGKEFDNEAECLRHELICTGEMAKFENIVHEVVDVIKKKHNCIISNLKYDYNFYQTDFGNTYDKYKYLSFDCFLGEQQIEVYISSDEVGDGRYDWVLDDVSRAVESIEYKFIKPTLFPENVHETIGQLHYKDKELYLDDMKLKDVLRPYIYHRVCITKLPDID